MSWCRVETLRRQRRQHVVHQALAVLTRQIPHGRRDGRSWSSGVMPSAVRSTIPAASCCLQPGDPDLEELVEIAAEDAEELEPLEQRRAGVERFVEDPPVELEPGELAVQVERRVPKIYRGRGGRLKRRSVTP